MSKNTEIENDSGFLAGRMSNKNKEIEHGPDNSLGSELFRNYALNQPKSKDVELVDENTARKAVKDMFNEFCQNTSMHGFKFITRPESTRLDSVLWFFMLVGGVAFSIYFSGLLWNSWEASPVIITIESANCPIARRYDFPTVTVCSVNRVSKAALERFLDTKEGRLLNVEDARRALEIITIGKGKPAEIARLGKLLKEAGVTSNDHGYESLIRKVSPNCSEMFIWCAWEEDDENCNVLFQEEATDNGYCCSFNSIIYHKDGSNSSKDLRKAHADGIESGLRILMDAEVEDYNVSSYSFHGFRISIQSPDTYVTTGAVGFNASPGHVLDVAIEGEAITTRDYVNTIPPKKRQCSNKEDHRSRFYQNFTYTTDYCELQCRVDRLLQECKCVPYNLPVPDSIPVCNLSDYNCVAAVNKYINKNIVKCNCLDGCQNIWYKNQITIGDYPNSVTPFPNLTHVLKFRNMNQKQLKQYAKKNFVKLNVYYKSVNGLCYVRDIKTSWSDFISSTGGLLGLGFGFSLLSAAEVFYYLFIRWMYYRIQMREEHQNAVVPLNPHFLMHTRAFLVEN